MIEKQEKPDRITAIKSQTVKLIKELTLADRSKKSSALEFRMKTLSDINYLLQDLLIYGSSHVQPFTQDNLMVYIRYFFVENVVKTPPLEYFKLILISEQIANKLIAHNIPLYLARILERDDTKVRTNYDDQAYKVLQIMNEWIDKFAHTFPQYLAFSLVAFAELPVFVGYQQKKKDQISQSLKKYATQIILNLSLKNPPLCCISGGFNVLINAITDPFFQDKSYDIVCKILYYLNQKKNRDLITVYIDIRKLFHIFTNIDNNSLIQGNSKRGNFENVSKFQTMLKLSKNAIVTLLKSWAGLIYIGNDEITINSLLEALKQIPKEQDSDIRKYIFQILEEIISLGDNVLASTFQNNVFRVSNLIICFLMAIIDLLIQNNLLRVLIELSGVEDNFVSEPAQRLLKKLTVLIFNFLPESSKYIDFLISAATKHNSYSQILKSSSSFVVNKIGNYIYDKKLKVNHLLFNYMENLFSLKTIFVPFDRSSVNSISKSLNFITYQQKQSHRKNLLDEKPILKDEKDEYLKWKWHLIQELLLHPDVEKYKEKPDNSERHKEGKMFKYLLRFYSPSKGAFIKHDWNVQYFQYVKTGMLIVKNVITIPENLTLVVKPPESQFQCTVSIMGELEKLLEDNLIGMMKDKYRLEFFKTMERQLITWIALFSENRIGYESLVCANRFFEVIYDYIDRKQCSHIINIFTMNLDFYRENVKKKNQTLIIGPRALLEKCAKDGCKSLKLGCLEIIKILFKAEMTNFSIYGYNIILTMLNDESIEVSSSVIDFLEEHLASITNIELFLGCIEKCIQQNKNKLTQLTEKLSNNILIRLISEEKGFQLINSVSPEWLDLQYKKWVEDNTLGEAYCFKLQHMLNNSLHFVNKHEKRYKVSENKNVYDMLFLYKLPLLISINDREFPLWVKQQKNSYSMFIEFDEGQLKFQTDSMKIMLLIGTMMVDQEFNLITQKDPFTIFLSVNSKPVDLYGQSLYLAQNNGISIYYKSKGHFYEIRRVIIKIKLNSIQDNQILPLHFIQELTKTTEGKKYVQKKKFVDYAKNIITSEPKNLLKIRSVLWSIGFYGSTNEGIEEMNEVGLISIVIKKALECQTLSLRGTCRYILNMFCHCEKGRQILSTKGFHVDRKLFCCHPLNINSFFNIKPSQVQHYCQSKKFWQNFEEKQETLTKDETDLFENIKFLINSLSFKNGAHQIREMLKSSPKLAHSPRLLQNVVTLLSTFRYKHESRKSIMSLFEQLIKSPQFNSDTQNKIKYIVGDCF